MSSEVSCTSRVGMTCLETAIADAADAEYDRAAKRYGKTNNSHHESYAVILEEYEEAQAESNVFDQFLEYMWASVKGNRNTDVKNNLTSMYKHAIRAAAEWTQVAAMCYKAEQTKNKK